MKFLLRILEWLAIKMSRSESIERERLLRKIARLRKEIKDFDGK